MQQLCSARRRIGALSIEIQLHKKQKHGRWRCDFVLVLGRKDFSLIISNLMHTESEYRAYNTEVD